MVDEVTTPTETEIEKLHKKLAELEQKTKPVLVQGYIKFKAFLNGYVLKYPVHAAWVSAFVGAGGMYILRKWFSF